MEVEINVQKVDCVHATVVSPLVSIITEILFIYDHVNHMVHFSSWPCAICLVHDL